MNEYVEAHKNQPAINKLLHNEPITADDYKELERIFTEELGTAEDYQRAGRTGKYAYFAGLAPNAGASVCAGCGGEKSSKRWKDGELWKKRH